MIRITVLDEVNVLFDGLTASDISYIIKNTAIRVKGCHNTPEFKIGAWDGKESQFHEDGHTFQYMLDKVEPLLIHLGYRPDQIEIVDERTVACPDVPLIDDTFLQDYGITLRYYQVDCVNAVIQHHHGIIEAATSAGKTFMASAISKVYDKHLRSLVIVQNENLGDAMLKDMRHVGLDVEFIHGKMSKKKRLKHWQNTRHIVVTWQTLKNFRDYLGEFGVVIYDEAHVMGDVMFDLLAFDLRNAPIRVGLTGTVPLDEHKREKIFCHIGGGVLCNVEPKTLIDEGFIARPHIRMIKTEDARLAALGVDKDVRGGDIQWEWSDEESYLLHNPERLATIADFIRETHKENAIVLAEAAATKVLGELLGVDSIDGEMDADERKKYYKEFDNRRDYLLVASYGTVSTGISINDIFTVYLIDAGKDYTKVLQSIGRGLRLDSEGRNQVDVYDIYAKCKYSLRHKKERVKIYKRKEYEVLDDVLTLTVKDD